MNVSEAVETRQSIRAFLDKPVDGALIRQLIEKAARAPSGGNLQPWHLHVLAGQPLEEFKKAVQARLADTERKEAWAYNVYPPELMEPYTDRRFKVGEDMYAPMNISREDRAARRAWFARNFQFFDAPVGLFCYTDRVMGPPQWSDLGMFLQTLMLLLREEGLDSCAQECWAIYPETVGALLNPPSGHILFCGMAIGYRDTAHPVNNFRSERAAADEFAQFHGL